jgi:aminoglycoside phosphotransferase (APT) family kinase protein
VTLPKRPLARDELLDLLRLTLGSAVEIRACTVANQSHDYLVVLVRLGRPNIELVVKVAGPSAPYLHDFDRTAALHRLVRTHTSIPMADVLAVDGTGRQWPWRYLIQTYVPGEEWATVQPVMDREELIDAYGQLGDAIGQLHSIRFPAFGALDANGTVQGTPSWHAALATRAANVITHPVLSEMFRAVLSDHAVLFDDVRAPNLCHEDLHKHNILFRHQEGRWMLATVLDFDKAWSGHFETDLARLELWTGMVEQPFWQPYLAHRSLSAAYEPRRPLYQLLWCLEYARPTPQHLAVTSQICATLGLTVRQVDQIVRAFREG